MSSNPLQTRLCDEYGCEVPIVAFAHTKDVIAAVTNAGGIGILGGAGRRPEDLRSDIRWIRERVGNRPFGVDLLVPASFVEGNREDLESMIPQGHRDFVAGLMKDNNIPAPVGSERRGALGPGLLRSAREQLEVLFEEKVPIFASGLGSPAFGSERAQAAGMRVWGLGGLPRRARRHRWRCHSRSCRCCWSGRALCPMRSTGVPVSWPVRSRVSIQRVWNRCSGGGSTRPAASRSGSDDVVPL